MPNPDGTVYPQTRVIESAAIGGPCGGRRIGRVPAFGRSESDPISRRAIVRRMTEVHQANDGRFPFSRQRPASTVAAVRRTYDFDWFKVKWLPRYGWVFERPPAVVVMAMSPDNRLWLERIARPATGTISWEMPGGGVDPDEDVIAAALRELEEECGLVATKGARQLGARFEVVPGMGRIPHYIVVASGVVPKGPRAVPQRKEGILAVRKFERSVVRKMVRAGRINVLATLGPLAVSGWLEGGKARW